MQDFKQQTRRRDGEKRALTYASGFGGAFLQHFAEGGEGAADAARTDTGGEAPQSRDYDAEFGQLIRGDYRDSFARRTQEIIDKRFAQSKKDAARLESLAPALEALREKYGLADETGLADAVLHDAEQTKAESLRRQAQEKRLFGQRESLKSAWKAEAAELGKVYPTFDFEAEMTGNRAFSQLLQAGAGVRQAYEAAHLPEILSSAMRYAAKKAGEKAVAAMRASAQRPQENGVMNRAGTLSRTDVANLTEREILKIIDKVGRGAKISF